MQIFVTSRYKKQHLRDACSEKIENCFAVLSVQICVDLWENSLLVVRDRYTLFKHSNGSNRIRGVGTGPFERLCTIKKIAHMNDLAIAKGVDIP